MNKPYFVYDPDNLIYYRFETREQQLQHLQKLLENYKDSEGWLDGIEDICAGVITEEVKEVFHKVRPKHISLNEDYWSKHGEDEMDWPAGVEEYIDYAIVHVEKPV